MGVQCCLERLRQSAAECKDRLCSSLAVCRHSLQAEGAREEGREGRGQVHRELGLPGAGRHRGQVCGWLSGIAAIEKRERILLPSRTFRGYIIGSL